jgi:hypothetical protein
VKELIERIIREARDILATRFRALAV